MRAFVRMREAMSSDRKLVRRLDALERSLPPRRRTGPCLDRRDGGSRQSFHRRMSFPDGAGEIGFGGSSVLPVLFRIGSFEVHGYGFFVALGILLGVAVAAREAGRRGVDREAVYDAAFWTLLAGAVGSRVLHVLLHWQNFRGDLSGILRFWRGGFVYYGGLFGGAAAYVAYIRRRKIPLLPAVDAAALGVPLGHFFGRLGCASSGCCYGMPATGPWAVVFTDPACVAPRNVPLHPAQIYEALALLGVFGLLQAGRKRLAAPGATFGAMLLLYGTARFSLEIFRGDPRPFYGPFSASQWISLLSVAFAVAWIARVRRRRT